MQWAQFTSTLCGGVGACDPGGPGSATLCMLQGFMQACDTSCGAGTHMAGPWQDTCCATSQQAQVCIPDP
jgi:hypothetical protein